MALKTLIRPKPTKGLIQLLLLEDDPKIADFTAEGLRREGFTVTHMTNGEEGLRQARRVSYDVILLDVMMPGLSGTEVLKSLRGEGFSGAILMVTRQGNEGDRVGGLNTGADDYIVKPFLVSELVSRVNAILRRTMRQGPTPPLDPPLRAGSLTLDLSKHEVKRGSRVLSLTKMEFDLLHCLIRRPGHVFSRTMIGELVFQHDFIAETNSVEVHIRNLRSKIDLKGKKSLIRTVRGCGYALDV